VAVRGKHGTLLAGRYRLLEQLGEGGMGSVWKAEHLVTHSHVAIKIVDPDVARLEFNLNRFLREAKTLASLRSPNVVKVIDFGSDSDAPYLVMELLEGQTLGRRLIEQRRLSLGETSRIMHDVCAAMALVHEQGLIHRDLKPENIFLCNTGEQSVTKVVDFGIAKSLRGDMTASMKTRTGHMLGTPSYMSPEQCRGLKDIDHRADLWALGVIAYECLVGKVPFEGEVLGDLLLRICMDPLPIPSDHAKGLPSTFDAWFAKAVARDRSIRFQSAVELSAALSELSTSLGLVATVAREPPPPSHPSSPRLAASAAPTATLPPPSNPESNTALGVGARFGRLMDLRTRVLAVTGVVACAAAGVWARGDKPGVAVPVGVDVQNLRPAFEVTPKVIRSGVPSGRRWVPAPSGAAGGVPIAPPVVAGGRGGASGRELLPSAGSRTPFATATALTVRPAPGALPPDPLPPHALPPHAPSSRGAPPERTNANTPGAAPNAAPSAPGSSAASSGAALPAGAISPDVRAPLDRAPVRALAPPGPLRGTAATPSTPSRAPAAARAEDGLRHDR
jgi:eukaryotic-like serine/threonine-protein kinase